MISTNSRRNAARALTLWALATTSALTLSAQATDTKKEKKEEVQTLEKFEVTGSRIKRIDTETVSPVVSITMSQIESQGFNSLGEAMQALPQNSGQVLTPTDSGTSFTPGVNTINLRGLGNNNTLVLLNGRRGVPYAAPGFNGFQTMFDFNSIPNSAIDRIEVLKDGASALYGSDAISGVVDVKLRRDFEGVTSSIAVGNYLDTDAFMKRGSLVMGTHSGKTSITTILDFYEKDATFARDFKNTSTADHGTNGDYHQANPSYVVTGWDKVTTDKYTSQEDYLKGTIGVNVMDYTNWFDSRSSMGYPGYVTISGVGTRTFASPTSTPTTSGAVAGSNKYNFQEVSGLDPYVKTMSFYTAARHDFSDRLYVSAEISFNRTEAEVHSAPSPVNLAGEQGLSVGTAMYIPSYNAYNPWGVDIKSGRRRLVEAGNRISDVTSDTPRLVLSAGGTLPDFGTFSDWSWETGMLYSKNSVNTINRNSVPDYKLQQALMGLTRNGDGSLTWNPATATSNRVYFNWFGLNEQAMADFLTVENPNSSTMEYLQFDAKASGAIATLPAGQLGFAYGFEHRVETMENVKTDLNATSMIIGGSAGTGFAGDRKVTSLFAELEIPILKSLPLVRSLDAQVAARMEDYSDKSFATTARPKYALKYKPLDWLIFRGSYSECFKAPDLAYLYTSSQTSFTSGSVYDPVTKSTLTQLQIVTAGNTELRPETTDVSYAGVAIEPKGVLKGLQISVDGFRYRQKNLLTQLSDIYGYADFLSGAASGDPLFSGKVVRNSVTNEVLYIRDDYMNVSRAEYKGVDIEADYTLKTDSMGTFTFGAAATRITHMSYDGGSNTSGSYLTPKWKANTSVGWRKGDWGTTLFANYYGKRVRMYNIGSWYDEGDNIYLRYTMDPRVVFNANVSFYGIRKTTISLGVSNLFNTTPAMDPMNQIGATGGVGYFAPTYVTMRLERKF